MHSVKFLVGALLLIVFSAIAQVAGFDNTLDVERRGRGRPMEKRGAPLELATVTVTVTEVPAWCASAASSSYLQISYETGQIVTSANPGGPITTLAVSNSEGSSVTVVTVSEGSSVFTTTESAPAEVTFNSQAATTKPGEIKTTPTATAASTSGVSSNSTVLSTGTATTSSTSTTAPTSGAGANVKIDNAFFGAAMAGAFGLYLLV